ncbi:YebC/PmpR family DNA-binding transcriptional regulator [Candidatus Dojkabacteria bacterium HGW-Dojkabacteria-1]|uniref:Probable transcriptional regulatory protein CVU76_03200 n=1 Tax=Candidatus Dojkabacteria bacterium HGW-Dojkabacteria-1 TaxID=2013761 RepID=A0A2N2F4A8_9BACT|nr:MAG: YebC/PmpR family DNA-binding transcriptional regulator [Candidatus Dojkabacteria bacterium HGW-Dojkabacteria-1]
MSGHSKWSTIKHKKAANDAKKGKVFSKLSTQITHAARQGGGDPEMNPNLRLYIDKAKSVGFPIDRIEKAISKGTGEGSDGTTFEEATYEGFGPGGIQIVVDTLTDNKNRTVSDLRKLFEEIGGRMGDSGSVSWNFDTKGLIVLRAGHMKKAEKFGQEDTYESENREEVMMSLMEVDGILDIYETELDGMEGLEVYTEYNNLAKVRDSISSLGYVIEDASIIKEPKNLKSLSGTELEKAKDALERLEDNDDVQNVWSDLA